MTMSRKWIINFKWGGAQGEGREITRQGIKAKWKFDVRFQKWSNYKRTKSWVISGMVCITEISNIQCICSCFNAHQHIYMYVCVHILNHIHCLRIIFAKPTDVLLLDLLCMSDSISTCLDYSYEVNSWKIIAYTCICFFLLLRRNTQYSRHQLDAHQPP